MTIQEYQNYVKEGASPKYTKEIAILGLMGELGELSDVVKKETIYNDMSKFEAKYGMTVSEKAKDELGDVLWQYMLVASLYNLSIDEIIEENVRKLNSRHGGAGKTANDGGGERN
jgi:NTP pyrophosphatase (non-canonical NTP hydrolase)